MTTYGFRYDPEQRSWLVTRSRIVRRARVVHSAPTLLAAENWVTRGASAEWPSPPTSTVPDDNANEGVC